jgi:hypothetical protein
MEWRETSGTTDAGARRGFEGSEEEETGVDGSLYVPERAKGELKRMKIPIEEGRDGVSAALESRHSDVLPGECGWTTLAEAAIALRRWKRGGWCPLHHLQQHLPGADTLRP